MSVTESLTTYGRQTVVGGGGARGRAGGRGRGGGIGIGGPRGGRNPSGPAIIAPNAVTSATLIAWYDASDLSTITSSANNVSEWRDKNADAHDMVNGSSASFQPGTGTETQNGLNVLTFAGNEFLASTSANSVWTFLHDSGGCTVFMVIRPGNVSNPDNRYPVWGTNGLNPTKIGATGYYEDRTTVLGVNDQVGLRTTNGTADVIHATSANDTVPANTWSTIGLRSRPAEAAGSRLDIRLNGGTIVSTNSATGTASGSTSTHNLEIGASGINTTGVTYVGAMAELLFYDGAMSLDEFNAVALGLTNKWGTLL